MICSEIVQPFKPDKMIRVKGRGYICSLVIRMGGLGPTDKSIFCKSSIYFRAGPSVFLRKPKALWKLIYYRTCDFH